MLPTVRDFLTGLRSMGAAAATEIEGRSVEEWIALGGMGGCNGLIQQLTVDGMFRRITAQTIAE